MTDEPRPDAPPPPSAASPPPAATPPPAAPPDDDLDPSSPGRIGRFQADLRKRGLHVELAALLAFLVPGLGHLYLGKTVRGLISLVALTGLFATGLLISRGECVSLDKQNGHFYAFFAQVGCGLPTGVGLLYSHTYEVKKALGMEAERREEPDYQDPLYVERLPRLDEGLLYTMIAGLLNLLLVYDAFLGAPGSLLRRDDPDGAVSRPRPPPPSPPLVKEAA